MGINEALTSVRYRGNGDGYQTLVVATAAATLSRLHEEGTSGSHKLHPLGSVLRGGGCWESYLNKFKIGNCFVIVKFVLIFQITNVYAFWRLCGANSQLTARITKYLEKAGRLAPLNV